MTLASLCCDRNISHSFPFVLISNKYSIVKLDYVVIHEMLWHKASMTCDIEISMSWHSYCEVLIIPELQFADDAASYTTSEEDFITLD